MKKKGLLALAIVTAAMVLGGMASAAQTGTTTVNARVPGLAISMDQLSLTFDAPLDVASPYVASTKLGSFDVIADGNWHVDVYETGASADGKMLNTITDDPLTNELQISSTLVGIATDLGGSSNAVKIASGSTDSDSVGFTVSQTGDSADAPGPYSIELTFAIAANL